MLILRDDPEHRARLIANVRRRMNEEIEQIASICEGHRAERALRRLRALTRLLIEIEQQHQPE